MLKKSHKLQGEVSSGHRAGWAAAEVVGAWMWAPLNQGHQPKKEGESIE